MTLPETVLTQLNKGINMQNDDIQGPKGPVFATAIVSGVMAAKQTSLLIPFCHQVYSCAPYTANFTEDRSRFLSLGAISL